MTALAVLRQRPLHIGEQGPDIVITQADVDTYHNFVAGDGSVVGVAAAGVGVTLLPSSALGMVSSSAPSSWLRSGAGTSQIAI